jgi:hypothetical protein
MIELCFSTVIVLISYFTSLWGVSFRFIGTSCEVSSRIKLVKKEGCRLTLHKRRRS